MEMSAQQLNDVSGTYWRASSVLPLPLAMSPCRAKVLCGEDALITSL